MFEIIQKDNGVLRFDDDYFYEIEGKTVKVFTEKNDFLELVTTVFWPIRVDRVDVNSRLCAPVYKLAPFVICKYCYRNN